MTKKTKLFQNGGSQAIRLPREFRFTGTHVWVKKVGDAVVLLPGDVGWSSLLESLDQFSPDFMEERFQPPQQQREGLD